MRHPNPLLMLDSYDPAPLLDALFRSLSVKHDAALAEALGVARSVVSRIRSRKVGVTADILIKMHDSSGLSIHDLRRLMGDDRCFFSDVPS